MAPTSHLLDIYGAWIHVATTKKQWKALERNHKGAKLGDVDSDGSVHFATHTVAGRHIPHLFIFINTRTHVDFNDLAETCAHEATHAAAQLLDHIGQPGGDSEALAYLTGWITRHILDTCDKANEHA